MKNQSFEKFYLTKVALGDCCGCAERVIDWRDIERAAQDLHTSRQVKATDSKPLRYWLTFLKRR